MVVVRSSGSHHQKISEIFPLFLEAGQLFCAVNNSRVELACRPPVLAALVHIILSSPNQSHELSCSELWQRIWISVLQFFQIGMLAKMYAHVGFFLFLRCLRVADSCSVCQQSCQIAGQWVLRWVSFLIAVFTKTNMEMEVVSVRSRRMLNRISGIWVSVVTTRQGGRVTGEGRGIVYSYGSIGT